MVPPLNFASTAASSANSSAGFDNSGFVVNYGGALSTGGAVPWWVWAAVIAGGVLWLKKR